MPFCIVLFFLGALPLQMYSSTVSNSVTALKKGRRAEACFYFIFVKDMGCRNAHIEIDG